MIAELEGAWAGTSLAYDDAGAGLPLVLLHGFPHDRTLWAHQRAALASAARVIAVDLRGFGASPLGDRPLSVDGWADEVVALLDHLGLAQVVVGGLSMGGYVALALWRRHADRVLGLALCDTRAGADDAAARARRDAAIALVEREGVDALVAAQLPAMLGATTHATRPDVVEAMRRLMARQAPRAVTGALAALRDRPDATATLATITVPVLFVVGAEDTLTPPAESEAMRARVPAGTPTRLEPIAGAGHASCLERPAAVSQCLSDFLAAVAASP